MQISKRNKGRISQLLKGNDIAPFEQYVEHKETIAQLSMAKWVGNGSIRLPEDQPTVDEALKICRKEKIDPMRYNAPGEIVKEWREKNMPDDEQKEYLSPDTFPDVLTNKKDYGNGITVYDVANTRKGQRAVRELMNSHLTVNGHYYNGWCLLYASESTGELTSQAWNYWNNYNGTQKKVAFKDGKIVSFCASSSSHSEWWDLSNKSHGDKIPIEMKIPNDRLGRSSIMEVDMETGEGKTVGNKFSGNKKNGLYREWNKNDVLILSANFKGGRYDGGYEEWYSNGQMTVRCTCKKGKFEGLYEFWYENGHILDRCNYKDGKLNGLSESWFYEGHIEARINYKDGRRDGLSERWYSNGKMFKRINYKDGRRDGKYEMWYSSGQIYERCYFKDDKLNGKYELWHKNGQKSISSNFKDGIRDGLCEEWYDNGQIDEKSWYENGQKLISYSYSRNEEKKNLPELWNTIRKMIKKENFKDGREMKVLLSIKPEFAEKIFEGTKKFEFRKGMFAKDIRTVVVYASFPCQQVIGEFDVDTILSGDVDKIWQETKYSSGITEKFYRSYFTGKTKAYAIKIGNVRKYKHPKKLTDLGIKKAPQSFVYL